MCIARTEPLVYPEYPKPTNVKYIWEIDPGFYVYADETENFSDNIYSSIEGATTALNHYADWLNTPPPEGVDYGT